MTIRKHPAVGSYHTGNKPMIIFITVCTKDRIPWLANNDAHDILLSIWQDASMWMVGDYIIMPDHIHLFATCANPDISLENWIKILEITIHKKYMVSRHTSGKSDNGIPVCVLMRNISRSGNM